MPAAVAARTRDRRLGSLCPDCRRRRENRNRKRCEDCTVARMSAQVAAALAETDPARLARLDRYAWRVRHRLPMFG